VAKDYVTFVIDSEVSFSVFSTFIREFTNIIEYFSNEVSPKKKLIWMVGGLSSGSAHVLVKGKYETKEDRKYYIKTVEKCEKYGDDLSMGNISHYPIELKNTGKNIIQLSEHYPVRFETEEKDSIIKGPQINLSMEQLPLNKIKEQSQHASFGSVRGRIESLTRRYELRFTLYDLLFDKAVSCYLSEGQEELMREAWGKLASVEGYINREAGTGRPLTIRKIIKINIIDENPKYPWMEVAGCFPSSKESENLGEVIEKFRNG